MFGVIGRNEYVGLAAHIKLEVWNRVLQCEDGRNGMTLGLAHFVSF